MITIKAAASLQTKGVYQVSRNPMYLGLALLYLGFTCYFGNWWNVILFPLLLLIVQEFVIKREERYLKRRFGQQYDDYQQIVRRWL
jgi:protein-S-isoprenylcysteine O-methyltransferase Ste14